MSTSGASPMRSSRGWKSSGAPTSGRAVSRRAVTSVGSSVVFMSSSSPRDGAAATLSRWLRLWPPSVRHLRTLCHSLRAGLDAKQHTALHDEVHRFEHEQTERCDQRSAQIRRARTTSANVERRRGRIARHEHERTPAVEYQGSARNQIDHPPTGLGAEGTAEVIRLGGPNEVALLS